MELGYYHEDQCDLNDLKQITAQRLQNPDAPLAADIQQNIPIYEASALHPHFEDPQKRQTIMREWAEVLHQSAGVFVIKAAQPNHTAIDKATQTYLNIIEDEKRDNSVQADHFAGAGKNDRVWNSLQKLCLTAPETFMSYFASPAIDAAAEAWLGPNYQMTAQINLVYPGGQAQQAHRDYHLGFQTAQTCRDYPAHVHALSPLMTLQGGIAHCDMPVDSGTTKLLPFSQRYQAGYSAWRRKDFRDYFEDNYCQLPLEKGDAIFFNPALFHAAGENKSTNVNRMVNLLQISSAFGRPMETVNRAALCATLYSHLLSASQRNIFSALELKAIIASSAEGYSFPTNLDLDPPLNGLAPQTQADLLLECLQNEVPQDAFIQKQKQLFQRQFA